jgi:hypothetical protein
VLKVGRSIAEWRDSFSKTMHTSGFYFAGEVAIQSRVNAKITSPVDGIVSGAQDDPIFSIVNTLFSTIFGRRLGTETDGTSLRANAQLGVGADLDTDTIEHFTANTRDVTLKSRVNITTYVSRVRGTVANEAFIKQGFAYAGPRWGSLNRFANTAYGTSATGSHITFETLGNLKVFGTRSSLDGQEAVFKMTSDSVGRKVKSNFAFPTEIIFNSESFDNTVTKFDDTDLTFDDTIP